MSEEEIKELLNKNIQLSEKILESLERQRKIRMWTLIIGIAIVVVPLIASIFNIPWALGNLGDYYGDLLDI